MTCEHGEEGPHTISTGHFAGVACDGPMCECGCGLPQPSHVDPAPVVAPVPRLEVGSILRYRGMNMIVHTCAWNANEKRFVGVVPVDVRPGSPLRGEWLTPEEAELLLVAPERPEDDVAFEDAIDKAAGERYARFTDTDAKMHAWANFAEGARWYRKHIT